MTALKRCFARSSSAWLGADKQHLTIDRGDKDKDFPRFPSRSARRSRIRLFARRNSARSTVGSTRHVRDAEIAVWRDSYRYDGRARDTRDWYSRFDMEARPWRLIKRPSGRVLTVCLERRRRPVIYMPEPRYLFVPRRLARIALRLGNERAPDISYARAARSNDVRWTRAPTFAGRWLDASRPKHCDSRAGV